MQPDRADLPRPEELLFDYAQRLQRHRGGRRALWFHLSRLDPINRHPSDIQLAANLLLPVAVKFQGEVFALASGDIVICLKDPDLHEIDAAIARLRISFDQDALMARAEKEGTHVFLTTYDMADQYEVFLARARAALYPDEAGKSEPSPPQRNTLGERLMLSRAELRGHALDEAISGHVQTSQGRIAIERLFDARQIASFESGKIGVWGVRQTVRLEAIDAFDSLAMALARCQIEIATALGEIERALLPALGEHVRSAGHAHHIVALRAEALMSPDFLLFDRVMQAQPAGKPWIAFWAEELEAERETIGYLQEFLSSRGYRLGITGFGIEAIAKHARTIAGVSFVEIDHPREIEPNDAEGFRRLVTRLGPEGVIISEIKTQKALVVARRAGVRLLSGPVVEESF